VTGGSGSGRPGYQRVRCGAAVRLDRTPVRQQLPGVLEDDHAVAEQIPTLLGVRSDDSGRVMVDGVARRALWLVRAHRRSPAGLSYGGVAPPGLAYHCVFTHLTSDARYSAERHIIEHGTARNRENWPFV